MARAKSTLMKVIAGLMQPDDGTIERQQNLKVAYLTQDVPDQMAGSVYDLVASGLDEIGEIVVSVNCPEARVRCLSRMRHFGRRFSVPALRSVCP